MVFIPIVQNHYYEQQKQKQKQQCILFSNTKKVVVEGMDFIVRSTWINDNDISYWTDKLTEKINSLAGDREVIDYQLIPRRVDSGRVDEYLLIVTCKKGRYD